LKDMLSRRRFCLELLASLWLVNGSAMALADDGSGNDDGGNDDGGGDDGGSGGGDHGGSDGSKGDNDADDQEQARKAVMRGDAKALRDILTQVKKKYSGEIVHVSLKQRFDRFVYLIKLIDTSGKLLLLRVDAKSGAILAVRGE
jgi:Peptidase propeptide and YPEB domain